MRGTAAVAAVAVTALFAPPVLAQQNEHATRRADVAEVRGGAAVHDSVAFHGEWQPNRSVWREFHASGSVLVAPGPRYGKVRRLRPFLGDGYRDVWSTPVPVPIIDLERTAGGLTPLREGGGAQTLTLHLEGANGLHYVLRSIDKDASGSLPEGVHDTVISEFAQDQISALNPYAALIVTPLQEAAGILHTAPIMVYIPDHPRLGTFREQFAGRVALLERKPDEDQSDAARLGFAPNVVGSTKLFEELREDNDERVDQRAYARARLFDMLISDWDRHEGQWRWAEFEDSSGTRYEPVPRDRDFAMARFGGSVTSIRRFVGHSELRRLLRFGPEFRDLAALNEQASSLDLRLTSELSREDWVTIAESLRLALDDSTIRKAVAVLPEPVYALVGNGLATALMARRNLLPDVASTYYDLLAETVDIVGSDKHERFEVERLEDGTTHVVVHKTSRDGELRREIYRRVFLPDETEEIRLFGLDGRDQFIVRGRAARGILVRLIGGPGEDRFEDASSVRGRNRLTRIYDSDREGHWRTGSETQVIRSGNSELYAYAPRDLERSSWTIIRSLDYSSDNGLFVGGGVVGVEAGFGRRPYAARHAFSLSIAPRSAAYNFRYDGELIRFWRGWDADLDVDALAAYNFRDFYGFGNETPGTDAQRDRYRARLQHVTVSPAAGRRFGEGFGIEIGPLLRYANVEPPDGRAEDDPRSGFTPDDFTDVYFAGARSTLILDRRKGGLYPVSGPLWMTQASYNRGVRSTRNAFARVSSTLSYYYTPTLPVPLTVALRVGGSTIRGDFPFWQAVRLGGRENLRGFAGGRFSGHTGAFANAEIRARLFDFNAYVLKSDVGLYGFVDTGRVWADGDPSSTWHQGYGGGVWLTPFGATVLRAGVSRSVERTLLDVAVGFFF